MQIEMRLHMIVAGHEGPVFGVMVSVNEGEDNMVHVAIFGAARDIDKIEFDGFSIGRSPGKLSRRGPWHSENGHNRSYLHVASPAWRRDRYLGQPRWISPQLALG